MTNRRKFLINSTMAASAVSFLRPFQGFAGELFKFEQFATDKKISLLHTSDFCGQWGELDAQNKMHGLGGLKNASKKIDEINREGAPIFVIHTGNIVGKFMQSNDRLRFYKSMSAAGYDAVMPGDYDLNNGINNFQESIKGTGLLVLNSNVANLNSPLPFQIITKGNHRLEIVNVPINLLNIAMKNTEELIAKTANILKMEKGCNLVICTVQASREHTCKIAALSSGVDAIVTSAQNNTYHNACIVRNKIDHEVLVSYAGSKGTMISRIDFTFNNNQEKIYSESRALFIGTKEESSFAFLKRLNASQV